MLADRIDEVATALREASLDCWFLQDFHGQNPLAVRMLGLSSDALATRRFAVAIHADGCVRKLSHRIEQQTLAHIPGETTIYASYDEYAAGVQTLLGEAAAIACEYSPGGRNPYLSFLDAGTVDLLRGDGRTLHDSGRLIQHFSARLTDSQIDQYERSAAVTSGAFEQVTAFVRERLRSGSPATEREAMQIILNHFDANDLDPDHPPIVAVGPNSGQPHYETGTGTETTIGRDQVLLIDLWGKLREPDAVFSDFTRMFFTGPQPPPEVEEVMGVAVAARDSAIFRIWEAAGKDPIPGRRCDEAARAVIMTAGYGDAFTHRLGHSITTDLHGSGAHLDSFEIIEDRPLVPGLLFSVEPGIYLPEFGVRTEVNVRIAPDGQPIVSAGGEVQTEIERLL